MYTTLVWVRCLAGTVWTVPSDLPRPTRVFDAVRFGLTPHLQQAAPLVGSPEVQNYLQAIRARMPYGAVLDNWQQNTVFKGTFRNQQELIHRDAQRISVGEPVVITALIILLQTISELLPGMSNVWSADRVFLSAKFGKIRGGAQGRYIAITDGNFVDLAGVIKGIVEYKCSSRAQYWPEVGMQKVAELVAWTKDKPDLARRRRTW